MNYKRSGKRRRRHLMEIGTERKKNTAETRKSRLNKARNNYSRRLVMSWKKQKSRKLEEFLAQQRGEWFKKKNSIYNFWKRLKETWEKMYSTVWWIYEFGMFMLCMCVPYFGKMKTIHKTKKLTDSFFSCTDFNLYSFEESPHSIYCLVSLYEGLG